MTEFSASCHNLSHAYTNVVVLEPVGGIDRAKVSKLKDVIECFILAEDSGPIILLFFDFFLFHCLVCKIIFEALFLVFCRVVAPTRFCCMELDSFHSSAPKVTDLASERPVLNVQIVFDFELLDSFRVQVDPRFPGVILGLVVPSSYLCMFYTRCLHTMGYMLIIIILIKI